MNAKKGRTNPFFSIFNSEKRKRIKEKSKTPLMAKNLVSKIFAKAPCSPIKTNRLCQALDKPNAGCKFPKPFVAP